MTPQKIIFLSVNFSESIHLVMRRWMQEKEAKCHINNAKQLRMGKFINSSIIFPHAIYFASELYDEGKNREKEKIRSRKWKEASVSYEYVCASYANYINMKNILRVDFHSIFVRSQIADTTSQMRMRVKVEILEKIQMENFSWYDSFTWSEKSLEDHKIENCIFLIACWTHHRSQLTIIVIAMWIFFPFLSYWKSIGKREMQPNH